MGFPIRISTDQSLFAAPRGFSQRTTSFIASRRQGIHQMPLRRLTRMTILTTHNGKYPSSITPLHELPLRPITDKPKPRITTRQQLLIPRALLPPHISETDATRRLQNPLHSVKKPAVEPSPTAAQIKCPIHQDFYTPNAKVWWAWEDLNFRPHAYQARALTT